jgi:hypothetical protein
VDFRATADADRHFAGVLQNVPVIAGSAQVWEIELERGIELWLGFTTRAGEVAHHLGPTMLERDGSRLSAIDSRAGRDLYAPLRPGVYTLIGFGGFAFAPAAVELSAELHQELDVTWWIADAAAYAELLAAQEKFEEAVKAGLVGPGDY